MKIIYKVKAEHLSLLAILSVFIIECTPEQYCASGCPNSLVGNGYCNEECNVAECNYDGGDCDTIFAGADFSYLLGINSNLTQDSTVMIDMPHIRFGDEVTGYEFPQQRGTNGQVLLTDGSGNITWSDTHQLVPGQ